MSFSDCHLDRYNTHDPQGADEQDLYLNGLAYDPVDGILYGKSSGASNGENGNFGNSLFKIDTETAVATFVGRAGGGGHLNANCAGELYMLQGGGEAATIGHPIIKVNKETAEVQLVGRILRQHNGSFFSFSSDWKNDSKFYYMADDGINWPLLI